MVLVVDDEPEVRTTLSRMLEQEGYVVTEADGGHAALDVYCNAPHDTVITDMRMPQMDGLTLIHKLLGLDSDAAIIVLTGFSELNNAVAALHIEGVYHYLSKSQIEPDLLFSAVDGAIEKRRLKMHNKALIGKLEHTNRILDTLVEQRTQALHATNRQLMGELNRRKSSEQALQTAHQNLERQIAERTRRLVHLNQQLNSKIKYLRIAEQQIMRSKTMLQALFDGISDPLVMVDRHMTIRMLNKAAKKYYGLQNYKDMLGKKYPGRSADPSACHLSEISNMLASGKAEVTERSGLMDKTRTEKIAVYPLSKSAIGLDGAIIQITDITETKILERQLLQNEKLASLGMLVAGIAHEINNPNGFITFNLPILRRYLEAMVTEMENNSAADKTKDWFGMPFKSFCKEVYSLVANMENGSHRISKIVSALRSLVQPKSKGKHRHPIALTDIIEHVQTLVRAEVKQRVHTFTVVCPKDLPKVQVETEALEQVLINLLVNAAHAADKPQSWIKVTATRASHDTLTIEVQDNGVGMDDVLQQKIFSPFFTTRTNGPGTGLGLCMCQNLVTSMGGTIEVESAVGKGSLFRLILPVHFTSEAGEVASPDAETWPEHAFGSSSLNQKDPAFPTAADRGCSGQRI